MHNDDDTVPGYCIAPAGFEAYCVLLFTIKLGPSVIESKEAAGFDDM